MMFAHSASRNERRRSWTVPFRIDALEQDADDSDTRFDVIERKIDKLTARATGLLISLSAAAIMLGINIAIGR